MTDDISAWFRWIFGVAAAAFGALIMLIVKGLKDDVKQLKDDGNNHAQSIPTQYVSRGTFAQHDEEVRKSERELRELITKVNERIDAQRREDDSRLAGLRSEMNTGFSELRGLLIEALRREDK